MLFEGTGVGNIFEEILENFFERTEVSKGEEELIKIKKKRKGMCVYASRKDSRERDMLFSRVCDRRRK